MTGLLEWRADSFAPGEDRWRSWSGRRGDVVLASVSGTVDDLRDPPAPNPWRAFALSVIGDVGLLGVGQGMVDGEYPTREDAQAAAEAAVARWFATVGAVFPVANEWGVTCGGDLMRSGMTTRDAADEWIRQALRPANRSGWARVRRPLGPWTEDSDDDD